MNTLKLIFITIFLAACGTNVKISTSGPLHVKKGDAALLLQYDFHATTDEHEIFFLDEKMNRYNVKVPADVDTKKGIVIFLPAGKRYALSSILNVRTSGLMEYSFAQGKDLTLFELKPDYVNRIPYFQFISQDTKNDRYYKRWEEPSAAEIYKKAARDNFKTDMPIRTIKIE